MPSLHDVEIKSTLRPTRITNSATRALNKRWEKIRNVACVWENHSRAINAVLWVVKIAIAIILVMSGAAKLLGAEEMVRLFQAIWLGDWLRYITGIVEVTAAILILLPRRAGLGAILAAATLAAGIAEHIYVLHYSPGVPAIVFAAGLIVIFTLRNDQRKRTV